MVMDSGGHRKGINKRCGSQEKTEMSESTVGSVGDITLLKEPPCRLGNGRGRCTSRTGRGGEEPHLLRPRLTGNRDHLPGSVSMFPHERIKNPWRGSRRNIIARSTRNECWSSTHRQAQAPPVSDPYSGTAAQFNREFNVIMGLVNLNLL